MKRYLAFVGCWDYAFQFETNSVNEIEIEKETPKLFYYQGKRLKKIVHAIPHFYALHDTREEAFDDLIEYYLGRYKKKIKLADKLKAEAADLKKVIKGLRRSKNETWRS